MEDLTAKILLCRLVNQLDIRGQLGGFARRPGLRQGIKSQSMICLGWSWPKTHELVVAIHARSRKKSCTRERKLAGKRMREKGCRGTRGMRWAAGG
ncbi:hypothetical protein TIFTF001_018648 [Ficus carica]|uniref:Uncharacterized protein n=1 Tax=Ficus carica TaxID=3494 RepID=A0AA88ANM9_FICCA|nr:hypothetical protein TIFTF001_018648 [Ficus carica]